MYMYMYIYPVYACAYIYIHMINIHIDARVPDKSCGPSQQASRWLNGEVTCFFRSPWKHVVKQSVRSGAIFND